MSAHQQGPVCSAIDACKWLATKGWAPSGDSYDRSKLAQILFTAAALPKVPPKANATIRAVAFLIVEESIDDCERTRCSGQTQRVYDNSICSTCEHTRCYVNEVSMSKDCDK